MTYVTSSLRRVAKRAYSLFQPIVAKLKHGSSDGSELNQFDPVHKVMPKWRDVALPNGVSRVQKTMLHTSEQQILYTLARDYYQDVGSIVDAGCFLGGSTLPLAHGLLDNPKAAQMAGRKIIHSYDLFVVEPWTIGIYFPEGTPLGTSFQSNFESNISDIKELVQVNPGDVMEAPLPDRDIEILFIDLSKHWTVNDYLVRHFFPRLIPGKSIIVQQDYLFHLWTGWLPVTMEYFADYFEIIDHAEKGSVVFFNHTKIPDEMLQDDFFSNMSRAEIYRLGTKAIDRWKGSQKEILIQSRDQLAEVLEEASYNPNWK